MYRNASTGTSAVVSEHPELYLEQRRADCAPHHSRVLDHSDGGEHYERSECCTRLDSHGVTCSASDEGDCWTRPSSRLSHSSASTTGARDCGTSSMPASSASVLLPLPAGFIRNLGPSESERLDRGYRTPYPTNRDACRRLDSRVGSTVERRNDRHDARGGPLHEPLATEFSVGCLRCRSSFLAPRNQSQAFASLACQSRSARTASPATSGA